ncbi:hypothetical protein Tco_0416813, partial [Tanacetum coccineum]
IQKLRDDQKRMKKVFEVMSGSITESNMLRAFSLFLLALAASEVFGADTGPDKDTGSVVAWSPLVIISHSI